MQKELDSTESIESSLAPVFMTTVLVLWFSLKWYLFSYIHQELISMPPFSCYLTCSDREAMQALSCILLLTPSFYLLPLPNFTPTLKHCNRPF